MASIAAGIRPDRVTRLALVEALGPHSMRDSDFPTRMAAYLSEKTKLPGKRLPVYPDAAAAARVRAEAGDLSLSAAQTLVARGLKPAPGGVTWRSDPRLRLPSPFRMTEGEVLAVLEKIRCPSLLVVARDRPLPDRDLMAKRVSALTGLAVHEVAGGHHVHLDTPEVVAGFVGDFLGAPLS